MTSTMEEAEFEEMGVYVQKRQNTVVQYIATQPILDLCERSVWRPGAWFSRRWWEKHGLDLGRGEGAGGGSDIRGVKEAWIGGRDGGDDRQELKTGDICHII